MGVPEIPNVLVASTRVGRGVYRACSTTTARQPPAVSAVPLGKRGPVCRSCGYRHFAIVYTHWGSGEKLIHRRECRHCGKRMTTGDRAIGASRIPQGFGVKRRLFPNPYQ